MASNVTRKYNVLSMVFWLLGTLCFITPIIVFCIIACTTLSNNLLLVFIMCAAVTAVIDCVRHAKCRVSTWLLMCGLVFAASLETVQLAVSVTAIGVFLDSLVFTPLHRHFAQKASINKEIDARKGDVSGGI